MNLGEFASRCAQIACALTDGNFEDAEHEVSLLERAIIKSIAKDEVGEGDVFSLAKAAYELRRMVATADGSELPPVELEILP